MRLTKLTPHSYAYRYPDGIRYDTGGKSINGSKPIEVIPLYWGPDVDALEAELAAARARADRLGNLVNEVNELNEIAEALYSTNALRGRQIAKIADKILNAISTQTSGKVGQPLPRMALRAPGDGR